MPTLVTYETHDGVALLQIDNPPVNTIDDRVAEALQTRIAEAVADPAIAAIVIKGAGRTFIAGADLNGLERAAWGDPSGACDFHGFLASLEDCPKPIVMAVHGTALGGGLETAMAGHYRVASSDAVLGLPEVNLGIIPGAEGTQRLPRLVGVAKALDMCVTGKPIKAPDALAAGLIDAILPGDLAAAAIAHAREAAGRAQHPKTRERDDRLGTPSANAPHFENARALAAKIRRNQPAGLKVIDAIEAASTLPFNQGCRRERELFFECVETEQAKALIHVFFAERAVAKVKGLSKETAPLPVASVAIVGAGTMGGGIAMACVNAGIPVRLKETTYAALDSGLARIARNFESSVARGRLTSEVAAERMARITPQVTYNGFETVDLVIEAVFENAELKRSIFAELDKVTRPSTILATNTSTLDIDAIASATSRPDRVLGLHFFSPANVMRLLEVVRGQATAPDVLATALAVGKRLGKVPVVVANCRGFVGNRMMFPYMYEAQFIVEEGATPEQVDRALTEFGMAMGIFAVDDMAGIDVAWRIRQELKQFEGADRAPLVADKLCEAGRFGQKTGAGWFKYDDARKAAPDPEVVDLVRSTAAAAAVPQRTFTNAEIVDRCILALVNEGAKIIEDGSAQRASDIDVIYTSGYGFPAWRGGPMFYADRLGLPVVLDRISALHREHGARWTPAPLLVRLASERRTFRDLDRAGA